MTYRKCSNFVLSKIISLISYSFIVGDASGIKCKMAISSLIEQVLFSSTFGFLFF